MSKDYRITDAVTLGQLAKAAGCERSELAESSAASALQPESTPTLTSPGAQGSLAPALTPLEEKRAVSAEATFEQKTLLEAAEARQKTASEEPPIQDCFSGNAMTPSQLNNVNQRYWNQHRPAEDEPLRHDI